MSTDYPITYESASNFELRLGRTNSEIMVTEQIHTIFYVMLIARYVRLVNCAYI